MGQLYLIRHGQASFGSADYDKLSELGWKQAEQLGAWLAERGVQFDAVYAGTMRRHRETAEGAFKRTQINGALPIIQLEPAFNELDANQLWRLHLPEMLKEHGEMILAPEKEVMKKIFIRLVDDWAEGKVTYPDMEDWPSFKTRVQSKVLSLCSNYVPDSKIAIFTSGGPITAALLLNQMGLALPDKLHWDIANASVTVLNFNEAGIKNAASVAGVPHLEDSPHLITHL